MKILNYFEELILFLALAVMTIISFANILSRNFANMSLSFTEEITINLFVLLTFVGTAVGVRRYAHLGFTLIFDKVGKRLQKAIIVFSTLAGLVLFGVLLWNGINMVLLQMNIGQKTPSLGMPQLILSSSLAIGALLCVIRTIQVGIYEIRMMDQVEDAKGDEVV